MAFVGKIIGFPSRSSRSIIGFAVNTDQAHAIRPLQSTARVTLACQLDLSTTCFCFLGHTDKLKKLSFYLLNNYVVLQANKPRYRTYFKSLLQEYFGSSSQPTFTSVQLWSHDSIGCVNIGVTAYWLSKRKHKPCDAEVGDRKKVGAVSKFRIFGTLIVIDVHF